MFYIIFTLFFLYADNNASISCYDESELIIFKEFSTNIEETSLEPKLLITDNEYILQYIPIFNENNFNSWALTIRDQLNNSFTYKNFQNLNNTYNDYFSFNNLKCNIKIAPNNRQIFLANTNNLKIKLLQDSFINYYENLKNPNIIINNQILAKTKDINEPYCELFIETSKNNEETIVNNFIEPNLYNFTISRSETGFLKDKATYITTLQLKTDFNLIRGRITCYSKNIPTIAWFINSTNNFIKFID